MQEKELMLLTDSQQEILRSMEREYDSWRPIPIQAEDGRIGIIIRSLDLNYSIFLANRLSARLGLRWHFSVHPIIWFSANMLHFKAVYLDKNRQIQWACSHRHLSLREAIFECDDSYDGVSDGKRSAALGCGACLFVYENALDIDYLPIQGDDRMGIIVSKPMFLEHSIESASEMAKMTYQAWRLEVVIWVNSWNNDLVRQIII